MLDTYDEILSVSLSLPPYERAMLADQLLESLNGPNQKEIDEGKVETIDGELVMQKLRS